jgi:hypothetical protein
MGRRSIQSRTIAVASLTLGLAAGTFSLGRSWASGVPTTGALIYSGSIDGPDGPIVGQPIEVRFWATDGAAQPLCVADDAARVLWHDDRFSVDLPDACAEAVHANADIQVEVLLGDERTSLGRSRLGAVPYALEAARASQATGALEARIAALEAQLAPRSAFKGLKPNRQEIPGPSDTAMELVTFEEVFDLADEFDQSLFVPRRRGLYQLACTLYYRADIDGNGGPNILTGWFSVAIHRERLGSPTSDEIARDGFYGDGFTAYRHASALVELEAGDVVSCRANHQVTSPATPQAIGGVGNGISTFEGYLVRSAEEGDP